MKRAIDDIIQSNPQIENFMILIDGRDNYRFESISPEKVDFIIKGDLTEPVISAASIVAKVTRDRKMCDFSEDCREYGFSLHKGY